jgi:hypothetical protein
MASNGPVETSWVADGRRCPKCGAMLLTDGGRVWCSFVGGGKRERPCDYGLTELVELKPAATRRASAHES